MTELEWDRVFALEQAGEDEEILAELLTLFRESSLADLNKIKEGIAREDPRGMADAAHSIKGAAASLGIEAIRKVAAEIEQTGRTGQLAGGEKITALSNLLVLSEQLS
ncbi:MAG: Hpt domain-containing protein [Thermodesulfobacteriota bacterium]